jgi:DNA-binding beta-propeller fold protein YncE
MTIAGGNGKGSGLNQLNGPWGIYVDDDQTVYITDYCNNRIVEWKSDAISGQVVADGNEPGQRSNQLYGPADLIVDKESDCLVINDYGNKRIIR